MARPLRIERVGGRFHATARGNERRDIFRDDTDRFHFLELLSDMPGRFGVRLHAYALMSNHFHLLIETPEANLSRSMQWLGVSYSVWFNQRHRRSGHLFQGRFKGCIVEDDHGWQEVARYVHLNPVRLGRLGLGKPQQQASRAGMVCRPDPEVISGRLRVLREYRKRRRSRRIHRRRRDLGHDLHSCEVIRDRAASQSAEIGGITTTRRARVTRRNSSFLTVP